MHVSFVHLLALTVTVLLALPTHAQDPEAPSPADRIVLKNGSTIVGTVMSARDGVVVIETDFAGTLEVSQDQVVSLTSDTPVVIQMDDGEVLAEQPLVVQKEQLVVTGVVPGTTYALADLKATDPEPWELGEGYNWTGLANIAWKTERGNSDTDEVDYKLNTQWLGLEDRYTLKGNGEIDEANGEKNADNWTIIGKYDRFLDGPNYWGINLAAEQDEFADLDLRWYVGPYLGRKFYDEPLFNLEAEAGLAYVNEDFIVAEDQEYPGANWNVSMGSNYLGGNSRLYLDHIGIWNLEETSDLILNTTFGLAFPLLLNFEAAAEIMLEYDSGAVDNVEELDQTYSFRIGYTW
ncbi:MAG: DUF481 domain-containing protein [Halioglobus sp.]